MAIRSHASSAVRLVAPRAGAGMARDTLPNDAMSTPMIRPNVQCTVLCAALLPDARSLADRNQFLGGMAADHHVAFHPSSAESWELASTPR
jgi:hypothetical protein